MKDKHILIAEDDPISRLILSSLLEEEGYGVTTAPDGRKAMNLMLKSAGGNGNHRVDLLVTDIDMPDLNGVGLIRGILRACISLPIIVVTGNNDEKTLAELNSLGIRDVFIKPVRGEVLIGRVRSIFGHPSFCMESSLHFPDGKVRSSAFSEGGPHIFPRSKWGFFC